MPHNKIYLIYTAVLFLLGVAFYIFGEFNRGEKPDLPDPNMIGKEEEPEEIITEPGVAEITGDEVEMTIPEPEEDVPQDISLEEPEEESESEEGEETEEGEEEEEPEPPIYDGHEEERIQMIKENYVIQERYDSLRWMTYIGFVFWFMALVCGILYLLS